MSATIMLFKLRRRPKSVSDLTEGDCESMGTLVQVRAALEAWAPGIEWNPDGYDHHAGQRYGRVETPRGWFRIKIETPEETRSPSVSLDCSFRTDARSALAELCRRNGWTAFDTTTSEFFDGDEGWGGDGTTAARRRS